MSPRLSNFKRVLGLACIVSLFSACANKTGEESVHAATEVKEVKPDVPVGDNSRNALDWPGKYSGVLPCADCEGIETTIELKSDNTYEFEASYLGKEKPAKLEYHGAFTWDAAGGKIQLEGIKDGASWFLVGENKLIQLDLNGERITGDLAARYELAKQP